MAAIKEQLGIDPELKEGRRGQFEVVVNGKTVAERKGGLIAKLMMKPWPDVSEVVTAVKSG